MSILILFLAGAVGALAKDILEDNQLVLPKKVDGKLALGSLGGFFIGGLAGYYIDGNPSTAFLAGWAGKSVIENLVSKPITTNQKEKQEVEDIIRMVARQEGVDPDLAVRVAKAESKLDTLAVYVNKDGSRDRGIFQINEGYHPEITDGMAFDPIKSTQFFCKAFKAGNLSWWDATKKEWCV